MCLSPSVPLSGFRVDPQARPGRVRGFPRATNGRLLREPARASGPAGSHRSGTASRDTGRPQHAQLDTAAGCWVHTWLLGKRLDTWLLGTWLDTLLDTWLAGTWLDTWLDKWLLDT